jgi:hypothetical protein
MLSNHLRFVRAAVPPRAFALLAGPAVLIIASCGSEEDVFGKRYPVSGTVTYNGKPLEKGGISFVPEDIKSNFGASGAIVDGKYTLSTGGEQDGAPAGKYKVTVTSKEDFLSKAKAEFQKGSMEGVGSKVPPSTVAKAESSVKSLIPAGYGDARTTNLSAEVKAESNTFNFELSDDKAPAEPPKGGPGRRGK